MAISRHSTEWLKVIFCAKAIGITFQETPIASVYGARFPKKLRYWYARLGDREWEGRSKYAVAKRALDELMGNSAPLPDAASRADAAAPETAPKNRDRRLRSTTEELN